MLRAIRHGLTNLTNFSGRDARQAFWFWVLFLYLVSTAIGIMVSMPMTMETILSGVNQGMAQASNPDVAAAEAATRAAILRSMDKYIPLLLWSSLGAAVILLFGLAAALVRRLHDSGLSGWWAALPGALQAFSISMLPSQMARMRDAMVASMSGDIAGSLASVRQAFDIGPLAGYLAMGLVIVLGVRKSSDGPNRFGDAPFVA